MILFKRKVSLAGGGKMALIRGVILLRECGSDLIGGGVAVISLLEGVWWISLVIIICHQNRFSLHLL